MTHICVGNLTIIGSDNGLSPGRRQAITRTNVGMLLIGPLGTNFSEMLLEIHTFSFKKIHLKMSPGKWRPFCLGLSVLNPLAISYLSTRLKNLPQWFPFQKCQLVQPPNYALVTVLGNSIEHDDVIKWKLFPRYWPLCGEFTGLRCNSPHKGQWRGALIFSFMCVWINGWVNNRKAGDLRCCHAHYDVSVMIQWTKYLGHLHPGTHFISME